MSEWKKVKLGEGIDVLSGFAFKSKDFADSGIPVVKIKNINPPYVTLDDVTYVPVNVANANPKYILHKGDVLIAMTGSHINQIASVVGRVGRVVYDAPSVLNQRVGKIVVTDQHSFDYLFIYYFLSQYSTKVKLANIAGGAANQANISPSDIKNLDIMLPPLRAQHTISKILYGYDSLISNYQRQIKLLEEAAQRLYKEWFVDLHFPGYENTKIVDGVPEGWGRGRAKDFFEITIGRTPPRKEAQNFSLTRGIPWVSISDMKGNMFIEKTQELLTEEAVTKYKVPIVPQGTILLSFKLTLGRVCISKRPACTNEAIAHFYTENPAIRDYTLFYLKNFSYDTLGNTSGISKAVNSTIIKNMPFIMPNRKTLDNFSGIVDSIIGQIEDLSSQLRLLTEARDRLLPKLMSGEIEV